MMLLDQPFKNVFVCSLKYRNRLHQLPESQWPEWLRGCHVISSIYCRMDEGHHFDDKGERHLVPISAVERIFPKQDHSHDPQEDE